MCGGSTVWYPLALCDVKSTDRVGVIGIGGLGHLVIQFASKMGCEVVPFSGTQNKREAMAFGTREFHATKGLKDLKGIKKIKHLLIPPAHSLTFSLYHPIKLQS